MSKRILDTRAAWEAMSEREQAEFLGWVVSEHGLERGAAPGKWLFGDRYCVIEYERWVGERCAACAGQGTVPGVAPARGTRPATARQLKCEACNGRGYVEPETEMLYSTCCQCDSEGTGMNGRQCAYCDHLFCSRCKRERIGR